MWTNLGVVLFVLLQVLFFGTQGLFSAMMHLIVVLCAGAVAIALWEPLTMGFLIERMPETAWGVGLLVPFVITALVLRLIVDKLVTGNVRFPQAVDYIGGGALGLIAGNLVAGLTVIGIQFVGGVNLQYKPYAMNDQGDVERVQSLWFRSDEMASGTWGAINEGAFSTLSGHSLKNRHGGLAEAAGTYGLAARPAARQSIRPANIEVTGAIRLTRAQLEAELAAQDLSQGPALGLSDQLLAIETNIGLTGEGELSGAADQDGLFTATAAQVALLADDPERGTRRFHPFGYVVQDSFGSFKERTVATSEAAATEQRFWWLFDVPTVVTPRWFRVKQTPLEAPETVVADAEAIEWVQRVAWAPEPEPEDGDDGPPAQTRKEASFDNFVIRVTDRLPEVLSTNWVGTDIPGASYDSPYLDQGEGTVQLRNEQVRGNLRIERYAHSRREAVVRVTVTREQMRGIFGSRSEIGMARDLHQPLLVADSGTDYQPRGYIIYADGSSKIYLHFTGQTVRSLSDSRIKQMAADEKLYLYFRIGKDKRIVELQIGGETYDIDPPLAD